MTGINHPRAEYSHHIGDRPSDGEIYRHIKTGRLYQVVCLGLIESDQVMAVVYRSLVDDVVWIRPLTEFNDGRFEFVKKGGNHGV